MCLILFALNTHPEYPLILAANRDESFDRPTQHAHFWEDDPQVFAGRDTQSMGTWLGVSRKGKLAAITNFRQGMPQPAPLSRGQLTRDFLMGRHNMDDYSQQIYPLRSAFAGFNLIMGVITPAALVLGYLSHLDGQLQPIPAGIHGLSNGQLNQPWPKVIKGKSDLDKVIQEGVINHHRLLQILADDQQAPDAKLPDTGIPLDRERILSPLFIRGGHYGTRTSTVLTLQRSASSSWTAKVVERNFTENGHIADERSETFTVSPFS